jgi:hypothetical protein
MKGLLRFDTGVIGGEKHGNKVNSFFLTYLSLVFVPFQSLHLHVFLLPQKKGREIFGLFSPSK